MVLWLEFRTSWRRRHKAEEPVTGKRHHRHYVNTVMETTDIPTPQKQQDINDCYVTKSERDKYGHPGRKEGDRRG